MKSKQKILYLVRHAKSSWKDASLGDRERPLNKRGRESAPVMGQRMAEQGHVPDLIISSPAKRAYSTAKRFAKELGYNKKNILRHEALYFSGVFSMCEMLEAVDNRHRKVMIVGHNPAMTKLLNTLCDASVFNMPTSAVAIIGFDIDSWTGIEEESGVLLGYGFPKSHPDFTAGLRD